MNNANTTIKWVCSFISFVIVLNIISIIFISRPEKFWIIYEDNNNATTNSTQEIKTIECPKVNISNYDRIETIIHDQNKTEDYTQVKPYSGIFINGTTNSNFTRSFHKCVGWDTWESRTCYFKNLCFIDSTWYYFTDESSHTITSESFMKTSISTFTSTKYKVIPWGPKLIKMKEIQNLEQYPYYKQLHFIYEAYNGENIGHVIGDELIPIFRALSLFGLEKFSSELQMIYHIPAVPMEGSCDGETMKSNESFRKNCKRNYEVLPKLLTDFPLKRLNYNSKEEFCVSDLAVGIGMLTDHCKDASVHGRLTQESSMCNIGMSNSIWDFRSHVLNRILLNDTKTNDFYITVMMRTDGKRWPSNTEDLLSVMNQTAIKWNIKLLIINEIHKLTLKEQLEIMKNTIVLITTSGGSSFIGLFLPKGSSMILVSPMDSLLDFHFWEYVSHTKVQYIQHDAHDDQSWRGHLNVPTFQNKMNEAMEDFYVFFDNS
jgi:hypothetical protein